MKENKTFEFEEKVSYLHCIEYEADENDIETELAPDEIYDGINAGDYDNVDDIIHDFRNAFGDSVKYIEDGSPTVEYEAY